MSTTFSLVVYAKPPHARPTSPSAIRMIPSVLFTAASFGGATQIIDSAICTPHQIHWLIGNQSWIRRNAGAPLDCIAQHLHCPVKYLHPPRSSSLLGKPFGSALLNAVQRRHCFGH